MDDKFLKMFFSVLLLCFVSIDSSKASKIDGGGDNLDYHEKYFGELRFKNLDYLYDIVQNFILGITGDGLVSNFVREFNLNLQQPLHLSLKQFESDDFKVVMMQTSKASIAYIVIVIIGLTLAIFYLISCLFFFCCRKKGCFCGKATDVDSNNSNGPIRAFLIVVVIIVSTLLILAAYGSLASGISTTDGMKEDSDLPFIGNVLIPIRDLFVFIPEAVKEINDTLDVDELNDHVVKLFPDLSAIVQEEMKNLNESCPSCDQLLMTSQNLMLYVTKFYEVIEAVNTTQIALVVQYNQLNASIDDFKSETSESLSGCSTRNCQTLQDVLSRLVVLRGDIEFPQVNDYFPVLQKITNYSISALIPQNCSNESEEISKTTRSLLQSLKDQFNNLKLDTVMEYKNYTYHPRDQLPSLPWQLIDTLYTHVPKAIKAMAIISIAVVSLIVLLNVSGVIIGQKSTNNSQGAFLISSQLTFCIAPILCLVTIALFVIGTVSYREGCYDIKKGSDSKYLKILDTFLQFQIKDSSSFKFDDVTIHFNKSNFYPITEIIYKECKLNESLVKSISNNLVVDNTTVDAATNKIMPKLKEFFDKFNITDLPIFSDGSINRLNNISTTIRNFSFVTLNESMISHSLTVPPLSKIRQLMQDARNDISDVKKKREFDKSINDDLPKLEEDAANLTKNEIKLLKEFNSTKERSENLADLLTSLVIVIKKVRNEINDANITRNLLKNIEMHLKRTVLNIYNFLTDKFGQTVHCRQLYEIFESVVFSVCDLIVNPLNALWFCLGVIIILFIPSFSVALYLGSLYARRNKIRSRESSIIKH